MQITLGGRLGQVVNHLGGFLILLVFFGAAIPVVLAPYTVVVAPVVLLLLSYGLYSIMSGWLRENYPKNVYAIVIACGLGYTGLVLFLTKPDGWFHLHGGVTVAAFVLMLMVGFWNDYILDSPDISEVKVGLGEDVGPNDTSDSEITVTGASIREWFGRRKDGWMGIGPEVWEDDMNPEASSVAVTGVAFSLLGSFGLIQTVQLSASHFLAAFFALVVSLALLYAGTSVIYYGWRLNTSSRSPGRIGPEPPQE